jgi:hypothetical protein
MSSPLSPPKGSLPELKRVIVSMGTDCHGREPGASLAQLFGGKLNQWRAPRHDGPTARDTNVRPGDQALQQYGRAQDQLRQKLRWVRRRIKRLEAS